MIQLKHKRDRYQQGSLTTESRKNGPDVWVYRWREKDHAGNVVKRKVIIGTKKELPTETAARKALAALQLDINTPVVSSSSMTISELADHYKARELGDSTGKRVKTVSVYKQHLDTYILPRWGSERIGRVLGAQVERWLKELKMADGTKAKTKAVFSALYQHALRHGWAERNPIRDVRQSAKPRREPDVLTDEEGAALLAVLPGHARAMVAISSLTALRRGEITGLQWQDVDFANGQIHVRRSYVDGHSADPKTEASKKPVAMGAALAYILSEWKAQTKYAEPHHWVFASEFHAGKKPLWLSTILEKIVRPTAQAVGISKTIGWHSFRRSNATWLVEQGENVKTTQGTLRHATASTTMNIYAQSIPQDVMDAQDKLAERLKLPAA